MGILWSNVSVGLRNLFWSLRHSCEQWGEVGGGFNVYIRLGEACISVLQAVMLLKAGAGNRETLQKWQGLKMGHKKCEKQDQLVLSKRRLKCDMIT